MERSQDAVNVREFCEVPFKYGGTDLSGWDCWGCVRYISEHVFGQLLPPEPNEVIHEGKLDIPNAIRAVAKGKTDFVQVPLVDVQNGDIVLLQPRNRPIHVGIVVKRRPLLMLHAEAGVGTVTEEVEGTVWGTRVEGFYRYHK